MFAQILACPPQLAGRFSDAAAGHAFGVFMACGGFFRASRSGAG